MRLIYLWRGMTCAAALCALGPIAANAAGATPAPAPPTAAPEVHDDFTYGPLHFRVETLKISNSVTAKVQISVENLAHSTSRIVLASMAAARDGVGLELTSTAGAACDAKEADITDIKVVKSEGETKVRTMTPVLGLAKLTLGATFHCDKGRLNLTDKFSIKGRVLTATEAGGFDIPLNFTGLTATAK